MDVHVCFAREAGAVSGFLLRGVEEEVERCGVAVDEGVVEILIDGSGAEVRHGMAEEVGNFVRHEGWDLGALGDGVNCCGGFVEEGGDLFEFGAEGAEAGDGGLEGVGDGGGEGRDFPGFCEDADAEAFGG